MAKEQSILGRIASLAAAALLVGATKSPPEEQHQEAAGPEATAPYVRWVFTDSPKVPEAEIPEGWSRPTPEELPRPTTWPAVLAFAVMLIVWGPVFSWFSTAAGLIFAILALRGWIRELLRDAAKG